MSRLWFALVIVAPMLGCSTFRQQQAANCSCDTQFCDNGECSDCLPPKVAGAYFYHEHIDWLITKGTAQKCAKRDLKFFGDSGDLTKDFRDGYTQAYIDLALGRPACVPAMPPKKYWHAWHRSCGGRDAVEQWYAGYRNGLDNGLNSGVSRFNRIVGSRARRCRGRPPRGFGRRHLGPRVSFDVERDRRLRAESGHHVTPLERGNAQRCYDDGKAGDDGARRRTLLL